MRTRETGFKKKKRERKREEHKKSVLTEMKKGGRIWIFKFSFSFWGIQMVNNQVYKIGNSKRQQATIMILFEPPLFYVFSCLFYSGNIPTFRKNVFTWRFPCYTCCFWSRFNTHKQAFYKTVCHFPLLPTWKPMQGWKWTIRDLKAIRKVQREGSYTVDRSSFTVHSSKGDLFA